MSFMEVMFIFVQTVALAEWIIDDLLSFFFLICVSKVSELRTHTHKKKDWW